MSGELEALAARVERYAPIGRYDWDSDRRRELNEAVATAVGLPLTQRLGDPALGTARIVPTRVSDYVGSFDAAMTLVDDNHWRVEDHPMAGLCAVVGEQEGYAATPVLALVAAALRCRARASLAREPGEGDRHG